MLEIEFNHMANDLINHAQERNPNNNSGPKIGGASWLVSIMMCWDSMRREHRETPCPLPLTFPHVCLSFGHSWSVSFIMKPQW